jgi:hypothetical protein
VHSSPTTINFPHLTKGEGCRAHADIGGSFPGCCVYYYCGTKGAPGNRAQFSDDFPIARLVLACDKFPPFSPPDVFSGFMLGSL